MNRRSAFIRSLAPMSRHDLTCVRLIVLRPFGSGRVDPDEDGGPFASGVVRASAS
jgi:hypothetical protein